MKFYKHINFRLLEEALSIEYHYVVHGIITEIFDKHYRSPMNIHKILIMNYLEENNINEK